MNKKKTKLRINLYLLKEDIKEYSQALKKLPTREELINISNGAIELYYKNSPQKTPNWASKIRPFCKEGKFNVSSSTCGAILLIRPKKIGRYFALCFGYGSSLLEPASIEEEFGLKVALNVLDHEKIKSIDLKNLDTVIQNIRIDNSKETDFGSFGADIERDVLNAVVGVRKNFESFKYAEKISGKEAIKFSTEIEISELPNLCTDLMTIYGLKEYQKHFEWIDRVKVVRKDKKLLEALNKEMVSIIQKRDWERIWLAAPEIIDWYDKEGFSYTERGELHEDINFESFLNEKGKQATEIDLETLELNKVFYHSQSQNAPYINWAVYKCIYCELDLTGHRYILVGGNWYSIDKKYTKDIDEQLKEIQPYKGTCNFVKYGRVNEKDYNIDLQKANGEKIALFDRKNISYGGGPSSIEFCDAYFDNKEFIHVKRYSGSSTLSHLFFQGLTPAYLLKREPGFLIEVNKKLKEYGFNELKSGFDTSSYEVVYAIATQEESKDIKDILPFFSKVALVHTYRDLTELYGYKVSLKKILLDKISIEKEEQLLNQKKREKQKKQRKERKKTK
jgi:uncharacterized protein (TIGR04141 family)